MSPVQKRIHQCMSEQERDRIEMDRDPLEKLNKSRTKRLEEALLVADQKENNWIRQRDPELQAVEQFLANAY